MVDVAVDERDLAMRPVDALADDAGFGVRLGDGAVVEHRQRAVRLTLIQQVVSTYIDLRATDRKLEITKQTLKVRQDSLELTEKLERGGSTPLSDVRQAEQLLYTASSQVPQLEQQIQQDENALKLLLGADPGPVAHTAAEVLAPPPQDLPTGLPSQLLERRPDIQQAEQTLVAANAQIGIARAAFFPSISLTGSYGTASSQLSGLFKSGSSTWTFSPRINIPIFAGGANAAEPAGRHGAGIWAPAEAGSIGLSGRDELSIATAGRFETGPAF